MLGRGRGLTSSPGTYETGAADPGGALSKMTAARNFRSACATMRQIAAKMDLIMHIRAPRVRQGSRRRAPHQRPGGRLPDSDRAAGPDGR